MVKWIRTESNPVEHFRGYLLKSTVVHNNIVRLTFDDGATQREVIFDAGLGATNILAAKGRFAVMGKRNDIGEFIAAKISRL